MEPLWFRMQDPSTGRRRRSSGRVCAVPSVSYTHLDVYKRQDLYLLGLAVQHGGCLASFDQSIAISSVHAARPEHLLLL